jgi:hypothetical protein
MLAELLSRQGCSNEYDYIEGDLKEVPTHYLGGMSPRQAMQTLGTEWGRDIMGEDFWVRIMENRLNFYFDMPVVVDDLRFPNEYHMLRKRGAKIVRIQRDSIKDVGSHPSEGLLDGFEFDVTINNNGTLEGLYAYADSLV